MYGTHWAERRVRALLPVIGLVSVFAGPVACGDDDDDIIVPIGGVTAVRDPAFNFTTLRTFAMPDTVAHFAPLTGVPLDVSRQYDAVALERVRQNLLARGYVQVTTPQTVAPDFVVLVGATAAANYDLYATYSWYPYYGYYSGWGWYAPGFDNSWGIVYPWYNVGAVTYDRGSLVVTILPTVTVNPLAKNFSAVWAGAASAILAGTVSPAGITAAIDEMFALSPYLVAGP